ncbi:MAG: putative dehydrogenase [Planctomycetota bacterium]|jgi:predicted dehydrogenase
MTHHPNRRPTTSPNRRSVLAGGAALAGASVVASCASDPGAPERAPATRGMSFTPIADDEGIRIGVIGTGGMGTAHCRAIISLAKAGRENVQIVAVADVAQPRAEDAAKICSTEQGITVDTYSDYTELLAREDIHGVLIASPEHWHCKMASDAIMAGKDVYVEKPMTRELDEAFALMDVVQANEQVLQVGTQKIMIPKYREAQKLIAAGGIGKPVSSQTSYCRNTPDGEWNYYGIDERVQPGSTLDWDAWCGPLGLTDWNPLVYWRWRRYRKYSTGVIGDLLVHVMTPLMYALDSGWPTVVSGVGGHYVDKVMENHDQVNLTVQFETEHTMVVAGSTCNSYGLENLIRGNHANMFLAGNNVKVVPERAFIDDVEPQEIQCGGVSDQDELRLNWLSCMRTREETASPVQLGAKVMVAVDLASRSMWDGKTYAFDPATKSASAL